MASPSSLKPGKVKDILFVVVITGLVDLTTCLRFKALNDAKVEVRIQFKDVTSGIFKDVSRNELVLRIQPSEAVYLKLNTKTPGLYTRALPTEMDLTYKRRFVDNKIPEAYEALILDALKGDHSNFVRHDELDHAWKVSISSPEEERWSLHDAKLNSHVPRYD
jgi:glucose-6-phosphate 1-dehydrogenase